MLDEMAVGNDWLGVGPGRGCPSRARRASEREVEGRGEPVAVSGIVGIPT